MAGFFGMDNYVQDSKEGMFGNTPEVYGPLQGGYYESSPLLPLTSDMLGDSPSLNLRTENFTPVGSEMQAVDPAMGEKPLTAQQSLLKGQGIFGPDTAMGKKWADYKQQGGLLGKALKGMGVEDAGGMISKFASGLTDMLGESTEEAYQDPRAVIHNAAYNMPQTRSSGAFY